MGWRFKNTSPVTESTFSAILPRILDIMMFSMKLIIMQGRNPPKDNLYKGNLILQPMERQQSKIHKNHCKANAALKSGGLTKVRTGDW